MEDVRTTVLLWATAHESAPAAVDLHSRTIRETALVRACVAVLLCVFVCVCVCVCWFQGSYTFYLKYTYLLTMDCFWLD